ncbi:collagen binding domain-containing protein [Marinoscillum sp. MHG1-6]|uniref:MSCRAMM family protein n=1 Tax=Marinoscillum sp. MHG1-6 TaxID=2959627 RepID=UPI0021575FF4|nr:carboxypeptidase-like regulatory domain-containing protein [Marinoscillum sp. MHG1-6]
MLKRIKQFALLLCAVGLVILSSCNKDDDGPTQGSVEGIVTAQADSSALEAVKISVFDANSNEAIGTTTSTNSDGAYAITLDPGTYYLRLAKLGFQEVPAPGVSAIPFTIIAGETVTLDYDLITSAVVDGGAIEGRVTEGDNGLAGVLVIASSADSTEAYTSTTDADGYYSIINIPAGTYQVKGWLSGYSSETVEATTTANAYTSDINISFTSGGTASLSGTVKFLATSGKPVDVSLVHPISGEVIPGLTVTTTGAFTIDNIPDGEYLARASYNNDTLVVDPDFIVKFGDPKVVVSGGTASVENSSSSTSLDFALTNSVSLDSPTNSPDEIVPVEVSRTGLTFKWVAYSSTSDYVVELLDVNGEVIWGGFDTTVEPVAKEVEGNVDAAFTSVAYTGPTLSIGRIYRWKVYASKDDAKEASGWKLISVSEDQMGLIKIIE